MKNTFIKYCQHPNCKCAGIKTHPKNNKLVLCEEHYIEVVSTLKSGYNIITLTNMDNV